MTWLGIRVDARHDSHEEVEGRGEVEVIHDQDIVVSELRLGAGYGITERFGVRVALPLRLVNSDIRYLDAVSGEEVMLVAPDVHHRNETLTGLGDPWLLARVGFEPGRGVRLELEGGLSLPLGKTEEDPFRLGDMGIQHQHVQFGTGTVNPIVGASARRRFGAAWMLGVHALTQQIVYENGKEYQAGDRYAVGVNGEWGRGRWRVRGGLDFQKETAERWHGELVAEEGNRGREDVLAGIGAAVGVGRGLMVNVGLKVPVVVRTKGEQIAYPAILEFGVGGSFDVLGGKPPAHVHTHDHDHGDEHEHEADAGTGEVDWKGVDVASISEVGDAVDLVPVAGVITVFDFWAPWCKPCKRLDALMAPLARAHPGQIAIRKLNVVDWDTPAAKKYLAGYDLPHLKVYGTNGVLVWEKTGKPEELVAEIERLLD